MPIPGGVADVIVSLADAKTELNLTSSASDAELQDYVDRATSMLLNHPAYRVADAVTLTPRTEWFDGGPEIVLAHYPVDPTTVTVSEFTGGTAQPLTYEASDGTSFTGHGWTVKDGTGANGILIRTTGGYPTVFCGRVKVVYTAGSATVPADIRAAALALIDHLWESQRGGQGAPLPSGSEIEEIGGTFGQSYGPSYALPNRVREMLAAYQRGPVVA